MAGWNVILKNDKSLVDVLLRMSHNFTSLLLARWCRCEPEYINTKAYIMPEAPSLMVEKDVWESSRLGPSPF